MNVKAIETFIGWQKKEWESKNSQTKYRSFARDSHDSKGSATEEWTAGVRSFFQFDLKKKTRHLWLTLPCFLGDEVSHTTFVWEFVSRRELTLAKHLGRKPLHKRYPLSGPTTLSLAFCSTVWVQVHRESWRKFLWCGWLFFSLSLSLCASSMNVDRVVVRLRALVPLVLGFVCFWSTVDKCEVNCVSSCVSVEAVW